MANSYGNIEFLVKTDVEDLRDIPYDPTNKPILDYVDLRDYASPVEDQRRLGSCVGQAMAGAYELLMLREVPERFIDLSRLFIYYNARLLDGHTETDEGAYIRDGIKSVKIYGVCSERVWPYHIQNFALTPSVTSYLDARSRSIKNYRRVSTVNHAVDALSNGYPVVFGLLVYTGFAELYREDSVLAMPSKSESPLGGHAMCLVGYDLSKELFLVRNSFGVDWGDQGYCWIPFDYARTEFLDMWVFDIDLFI